MRHLILVILCLSIITMSCGNRNQAAGNAEDNINTSDTVQLKPAAELSASDLYVKNCKFCHGGDGHGDGVKARLSEGAICPVDLAKEKNPDEFIFQVILNGKGKMPAQKELAEEEIKQLVVFIRSFAS